LVIDLDLLGLKPCLAGRFVVCLLANIIGILTYFRGKVKRKFNRGLRGKFWRCETETLRESKITKQKLKMLKLAGEVIC